MTEQLTLMIQNHSQINWTHSLCHREMEIISSHLLMELQKCVSGGSEEQGVFMSWSSNTVVRGKLIDKK